MRTPRSFYTALAITCTCSNQFSKITTKVVSELVQVYNDAGTGANTNVSVWRGDMAKHPGYYSLGDFAHSTHAKPESVTLVKASGDLLAAPADYEFVWNDSKSGGKMDGSFWHPIPPAGYTCLGAVANGSHGKPSPDAVRCVKSAYVTQGQATSGLWTDAGSGARGNVGLWWIAPRDANGFSLGTFMANNNHGDSGPPSLYNVLKSSAIEGLPELPSGDISEAHAKAYAPRVYFGNEEFFPSSVEFFLPNVKDDQGYYTTNEPLGGASSANPRFLRGQRPDAANLVPVYAMIVPKPNDKDGSSVTDIVYWMFYPYNRGKRVCIGIMSSLGCAGGYSTFGHHVGDWEHMTVRFKNGVASQIYLSSHNAGETYQFGDARVKLVDGQHPVVYAAEGSHGLYAAPGRYVYKKLPNNDTLVDYTGVGINWDTWRNVKTAKLQSRGSYTGDWHWLNYEGRWGNRKSDCVAAIGQCILEEGPHGPMLKKASDPTYSGLD